MLELVSSPDLGCFSWFGRGKLKPSFRGFDSDVKLVCTTFTNLTQGGPPNFVFGPSRFCDGPCDPNNHPPDPCGNFSFPAQVCTENGRLGPEFVCTFVAHLQSERAPQG